jgi:excinuclease ABC subunit B
MCQVELYGIIDFMTDKFNLKSRYKATPDQIQAVDKLAQGVLDGKQYQTLLGVTGSGKTFTMANVINKLNRPALIMSHNKTLAAQLYQELRDFFPENAVSYFVSYYDYYQPEAYIPSTDTYIEKDSDVNDLIDKLRLAATTNLLTRHDTVVVASVSCIYNIGSPKEYGNFIFDIEKGKKITRDEIVDRLLTLQYERGDFGFHRGTFRVRGDVVDIYPAYQDQGVSLELVGETITNMNLIDTITGENLSKNTPLERFILYPAKHFITDPIKNKSVFEQMENDLQIRVAQLKAEGKELEAHRLTQKVTYDMEQIKEFGFVKGIENYSRYFDGRKPGEAPYSLLEYFNEVYGKDWLVFVDESHISLPQVRGMYAGDLSRKQTLIDYGFRLPSALDNRPLRFEEFMRKIPGFIAVSATPSDYELGLSEGNVVEQLLRPTGIPDPIVEVRPTATQVADVLEEIKLRASKGQRTLVTTLTKRTAEDLSEFLKEKGLKVAYLHSDVETLDRTDILDELRAGTYDCLIGINLLREGLDLPEVSLVAILDADKEGFLRSDVSLIQTMGRAARHIEGKVILYADKVTNSMRRAMDEVGRRREYQLEMNKKFGITPTAIEKPIREKLVDREEIIESPAMMRALDTERLTPSDTKSLIKDLKREMRLAAEDLNFELAANIRDKIRELEG